MSEMKKVTYLAMFLLLVGVSGCISSETSTRNYEPSEAAGDTNYQLGGQYDRNGNFDLAQSRLERAIELDSRNASYHSLLALTFVQLGNHRLANESFERSVRLGSNDKNVRNSYAVYLCQQGQFDDALEQFDEAIDIRENDNAWVEMTNAGVCVSQKPDLERAEQYFRNALARRSTYGEALIQMAALKQRTGDCLTARAFLQRFLATNPPSAPVLYLAVQIETSCNDDRAATDYMNQLFRDFPESPESNLLLQQKSE